MTMTSSSTNNFQNSSLRTSNYIFTCHCWIQLGESNKSSQAAAAGNNIDTKILVGTENGEMLIFDANNGELKTNL